MRNDYHNKPKKQRKYTSKHWQWYLPDVFVWNKMRADEIKMGRRIPVKKMNIWYPKVAMHLKKDNWAYYFVEDTKYEWHYYDMIGVLTEYYKSNYGKDWNSGVYDNNPQPWVEVPKAYRIKTIVKPQKYIWKN